MGERDGEIPVSVNDFSPDDNGVGFEGFQILEENHVGPASRRQGPHAIEAIVAGRVCRGEPKGEGRVKPARDADPQMFVQVSDLGEVRRISVVRREHEPVLPTGGGKGKKGFEVVFRAPLAHLDEHAEAEFFLRFFQVGALVIGFDPRGGVGEELVSRQSRGVAIHGEPSLLRGGNFPVDLGVRVNDAWIVHHLTQGDHVGHLQQFRDLPDPQDGPWRVQG